MASGERRPILWLNGSTWSEVGEPPTPIITGGDRPRTWAYPYSWNSSGDARSSKSRESGGVGFAEFEALSKQVPVRAAIETVKNTQGKRQWVFQLKPKPGERAIDAALRATSDPRLAEITDFFESPDGEHDLAEWVRLLMEDLLVYDAATVYNVRSLTGRPYEIEVFPGSTIKPLLDVDGRSPRGIDPETGQETPAYQQWLYGQPGERFSHAEMIYAPRNPRSGKAFGCSPVEQLLLYINIALRKDLARLATYTDGNIPSGLLPMPESWDQKQIVEWWVGFNATVQGLPQELTKLVPIPGGTGNPIFPALDANKDLWEDSWVRLVCFAFDIPVQSLVKEMNRATAESARDTAEQDGQAAYTDWIRRLLNRIIRQWFGYKDIVAIPKREADVEAKTQAEIDDIEIRTGTLQINEKREREGRAPLKELDGKVGYFGPAGFVAFDAPAALVPAAQLHEEDSAKPVATPEPPTAAAPEVTASREFNGAQVSAVVDMIVKVTTGDMPRDSAIGVAHAFFGLDDSEAESVLGSAGKKVPTTPNPRPAETPTEDTTPSAEQATAEATKAEGPFEYGSTQINISGPIAAAIIAMSAAIPDDVLAEEGREDDVHVTVKYGLDATVKATQVADVLATDPTAKEIAARGAVMTLRDTAFFAGEDYDVVFIAVDAPDLVALNGAIAEYLPVTDTHATYIPHITLAYVQTGRGAEFAGDGTLNGVQIKFSAVTFSGVGGEEIEIPLVAEAQKAKARTLTMPQRTQDDIPTTIIADFLKAQVPTAVAEARRYFTILGEGGEASKADATPPTATVSIEWSDLQKLIEPSYQNVFGHVATEAFGGTGATGPFDQLNRRAARYASERSAELVTEISNATRDSVRSAVESAFEDGLSPDELAEKIEDLGDFTPARAERIARTEMADTQSAATIDGWKESGMVSKKRWLLAENPCEICITNADAGEIDLEDDFPSGDQGPTAHPHCSCDIAAVVEEAE